jgi:hypothetical protein
MGKRKARPTFYWVIEGFDGTEKIYSEKIKSTLLSVPRMEALLSLGSRSTF